MLAATTVDDENARRYFTFGFRKPGTGDLEE